MPVTVDNNRYIVVAPELGLRQDFDPQTGKPFANQAVAQAFLDAQTAAYAAAATAAQAAYAQVLKKRLALEIQADKPTAQAGATVTLSSRLKDGVDAVAAITESFYVPIEDEAGRVVMIKRVDFAQGVATTPMVFPRSGYYRLTEAGINSRLPEDRRIALPAPFEVLVWE